MHPEGRVFVRWKTRCPFERGDIMPFLGSTAGKGTVSDRKSKIDDVSKVFSL
jgi:hypothetical protein